ncbi:MAG: DUF4365 domain-containing protein [Verrucomicrobia bacterium]|nr:DUF4365 domain-containing protein [Verrucomicrobiota bacterium]
MSYAYLHAVVSHAAMSCRYGTRLEDKNGIDATITAWGPFPGGGRYQEIDLKVQLKATIDTPTDYGTHCSYFFRGISQYEDLRKDTVATHRILVVLFLPRDASEWLTHDVEALTMRKCAFWVSLRGAPEPTNTTGETIKIPKHQVFNPDNLKQLMARLSRREIPVYENL